MFCILVSQVSILMRSKGEYFMIVQRKSLEEQQHWIQNIETEA